LDDELLELFPDIVRPFARGVLGRLDLLSSFAFGLLAGFVARPGFFACLAFLPALRFGSTAAGSAATLSARRSRV